MDRKHRAGARRRRDGLSLGGRRGGGLSLPGTADQQPQKLTTRQHQGCILGGSSVPGRRSCWAELAWHWTQFCRSVCVLRMGALPVSPWHDRQFCLMKVL